MLLLCHRQYHFMCRHFITAAMKWYTSIQFQQRLDALHSSNWQQICRQGHSSHKLYKDGHFCTAASFTILKVYQAFATLRTCCCARNDQHWRKHETQGAVHACQSSYSPSKGGLVKRDRLYMQHHGYTLLNHWLIRHSSPSNPDI